MPSTLSTPAIRPLAMIGGLALVIAACSAGPGTAPSAAASAPPSVAAPSPVGSGEEHLVAVADGAVGPFLTGDGGGTLYVFTPDSANTSTCADACAEAWPPFTIPADDTLRAGAGVTGALTTFARSDGALQVAIEGAPLYYFASDAKAGDTNGQGVGGKWFVASPSGGAPSPAASGKGDY